ncbi:MAG: hypothetical protein NVS3B16_19620 [Vulcanimicrobiaceae bacterium]
MRDRIAVDGEDAIVFRYAGAGRGRVRADVENEYRSAGADQKEAGAVRRFGTIEAGVRAQCDAPMGVVQRQCEAAPDAAADVRTERRVRERAAPLRAVIADDIA